MRLPPGWINLNNTNSCKTGQSADEICQLVHFWSLKLWRVVSTGHIRWYVRPFEFSPAGLKLWVAKHISWYVQLLEFSPGKLWVAKHDGWAGCSRSALTIISQFIYSPKGQRQATPLHRTPIVWGIQGWIFQDKNTFSSNCSRSIFFLQANDKR